MERLVLGYDRKTAPTILVPKIGHTQKTLEGNRLATSRGNAFDNAQELLQRDIDELKRVYPEVPKK